MKSYKLSLLLGAGAALLPQAALAQSAEIFGDFRGRYESVEQTGKLEAESLTLRSRVGVRFKPADTRFSFLAEIENNITLAGDEDRTAPPGGILIAPCSRYHSSVNVLVAVYGERVKPGAAAHMSSPLHNFRATEALDGLEIIEH